jgi:hypothetical protein
MQKTKQVETKPEYTTRTVWSHGTQTIIVEQKLKPQFYGAIEI